MTNLQVAKSARSRLATGVRVAFLSLPLSAGALLGTPPQRALPCSSDFSGLWLLTPTSEGHSLKLKISKVEGHPAAMAYYYEAYDGETGKKEVGYPRRYPEPFISVREEDGRCELSWANPVTRSPRGARDVLVRDESSADRFVVLDSVSESGYAVLKRDSVPAPDDSGDNCEKIVLQGTLVLRKKGSGNEKRLNFFSIRGRTDLFHYHLQDDPYDSGRLSSISCQETRGVRGSYIYGLDIENGPGWGRIVRQRGGRFEIQNPEEQEQQYELEPARHPQ